MAKPLDTALWLFANVILAFIPVFAMWFFGKVLDKNTDVKRVAKDGDIFFFSSTLAAAAITSAIRKLMKLTQPTQPQVAGTQSTLLQPPIQAQPNIEGIVWVLLALVLVLLVSSVMYGGLNLLKVSTEGQLKSNSTKNILDSNFFFNGSIGISIATIFLSYYIFVQGGGE